jgi:uncharacterized protein
MPSALTYPGVYIEEIPSGVRTIIGVGTSIAAFIGRAEFGPVNRPIVINGYADFERRFGGLWRKSKLGYAVRDFFLNGGSQAIIVRLFSPSPEDQKSTEKLHQEAKAQATAAANFVANAAEAAKTQNQTKNGLLTAIQTAVDQASKNGAAAALAAKTVQDEAAKAGSKVTLDATIENVLLAIELVVAAAKGKDIEPAKGVQTAAIKAKDSGATLTGVVIAANKEAQAIATGDPTKAAAANSVAEAANEVGKGGKLADDKSLILIMVGAAKSAVERATTVAADEVAPSHPGKTIITVGETSVEGVSVEAFARFIAADEGLWGKNLRATVDFDVSESAAISMGVPLEKLFNLTISDRGSGEVEQFRNLTIDKSARQIDGILAKESTLVRFFGDADSDKLKALRETKQKLETNLDKAKTKLKTEEDRDPPDPVKLDAAKKEFEEALRNLDLLLSDPATVAEKELAAAEAARNPEAIAAAKQELKEIMEGLAGSDGGLLNKDDFIGKGKQGSKQGLYALADADLFNILCIPPYADGDVERELIAEAAQYCERRRAMLLVDPPSSWNSKESAKDGVADIGTNSKNAALFFPRLLQADPLLDGQVYDFVPCGAVAGIFARTDATRGVWKAPAGFEATLVGVPQLEVPLTDGENGELNPLGINCLRTMPAAGRIVWGSRTLQGDDRLASDWKYIPVRRTALFIEESLYRGTQWVVFEPNDEPLWAQIRLNVGAFMNDLFRQGAFQGQTPRDAYFVKCSSETTTQNDINKGVVNILVGFAPLKPAEFVVVKLQQIAGQIQT